MNETKKKKRICTYFAEDFGQFFLGDGVPQISEEQLARLGDGLRLLQDLFLGHLPRVLVVTDQVPALVSPLVLVDSDSDAL